VLLVQAHVEACADCAAELEAVRAARAAVRSLPAVEPPAGFFERLLDVGAPTEVDHGAGGVVVPMRRRRMAMAQAAVAVAAGLVLVVSFGGQAAQAVSPEVEGAMAQHTSALSAVSAGLGGPEVVGPSGSEPPPTRLLGVSHPYVAPRELAGYSLVGIFRAPAGVQLVYEKDGFGLSVFEQEGRLDAERLPGQGRWVRFGGDGGWAFDGGRGHALVAQRGALVVTLVGEESAPAVLAAAAALPGRPQAAFGTRVRRACGDALELLSPTG
jgi:hypothetical protein